MPHVYVSNALSGDIHVMQWADTRRLTLTSTCVVGAGPGPICISPMTERMYVAKRGEPNSLVCLQLDRTHGQLNLLYEMPLTARMCNLRIDRTGRFLLAVSYHSHSLTVCPLTPAQPAASDHTVMSTLRHPHAAVFSPDNRFVLVPCLGDDGVMVFGFDESRGQLTLHTQWQARAGSGPRHLCFHPEGQWLYLLNELDATLDVLAWDAAQGTLQHMQTLNTLPSGFTGKPWAADIHVSADGQFVYTCDRSSSTLAVFKADAQRGALTWLAHVPTELQPRSFALDVDGRHVLVAGQKSNHLGVFERDAQTGLLTLTQRLATGEEPGWVTCLA